MYTADGQFWGDDASFRRFVTEKYKIEEAESDLNVASLDEVLQRQVELNTAELRQRKELFANGVPITEQAEKRTQNLIASSVTQPLLPREGLQTPRDASSKPSGLLSEGRGSGSSARGYKSAFKVIPGIQIARSIDGGTRFTLWSSVFWQKQNENNKKRLPLLSEALPDSFLLEATIPRGSPAAACDFRLLLHNEPLSRNHMALVPRECIVQASRQSTPKTQLISLVTGTS